MTSPASGPVVGAATAPVDGRAGGVPRVPRPGSAGRLGAPSGLALGIGVLWLSLIVLLPIAAIVVTSLGQGVTTFWAAVTAPEALATLRLSVGLALAATVVNAVAGPLIAWVLVRDEFPGKRLVEVVIDLPFALPTIVAGLVLISLYGPSSPLGVDLVGTRTGIEVALLFVTLPFVVRSVQPVLIEMDTDVEEAAASLGAGGLVIFARIILPTILPAVLSGAALAFARALGEYGSVILISGNLIGRTEVSSSFVLARIEQGDRTGAAAVATLLLVVAVAVLALLEALQRSAARRG